MKLQELFNILQETKPTGMNVGVRQHSDDGMCPENFPIHTFEVGQHVQGPSNKDIPMINVLIGMDRVPTTVECLANSIKPYLSDYSQEDVFVTILHAQNPMNTIFTGIKMARVCPDRLKFSIEY